MANKTPGKSTGNSAGSVKKQPTPTLKPAYPAKPSGAAKK